MTPIDNVIVRPRNIEGVRAFFGNPDPYRNDDGTISPRWEGEILVRVPLPAPLTLGWDDQTVKAIRCHRKLAKNLAALLTELHGAGQWPLIRTFDGCYAWRPNRRNPRRMSLHCWGAAIDLNASTNHLGSGYGDQPQALIDAFARFGWYWGGDFSRPDPMHFQYAEGV